MKLTLGLILSVYLTSCVALDTARTPAIAPPTKGAIDLGQVPPIEVLPISAQIKIAGQKIGLEVAQTPEQQATGLMYRTTLAENRGMLFPFNPPRPVKFWMENTLIPLDMIFLRHGVIKAIAANVPPCTTTPCSTYGPVVPIDQVVELASGRAAKLGLKVGDRIEIQFLDTTQ